MISNDNFYIPKEELILFTMNCCSINVDVRDIGWWLETKTDNMFTVVERNFIINTLSNFDSINLNTTETVRKFKEEWMPLLRTLRRTGGYSYSDED